MAKIDDIKLWNTLRARIKMAPSTKTPQGNIEVNSVLCREADCHTRWNFPTEVYYWSGPHAAWDYSTGKYVGAEHLQDAWNMLDDIVKHFEEKHEIKGCEFCGRMTARRGLTKHQKGVECLAQQRNFVLEQNSLVEVTEPYVREIKDAVTANLTTLAKHVDWTDVELYRELRDECQRAEDGLLDALQVEVYRSKYTRGSGWQEAYWVNRRIALYLELVRKQICTTMSGRRKVGDTRYNEALLSALHEWIDLTDPKLQDALLGGLELALDNK